MIRVVRMGTRWYGLRVDRIDEEEAENIETFVDEGSPVLLCYDLEEAREFLGADGIEMVE